MEGRAPGSPRPRLSSPGVFHWVSAITAHGSYGLQTCALKLSKLKGSDYSANFWSPSSTGIYNYIFVCKHFFEGKIWLLSRPGLGRFRFSSFRFILLSALRKLVCFLPRSVAEALSNKAEQPSTHLSLGIISKLTIVLWFIFERNSIYEEWAELQSTQSKSYSRYHQSHPCIKQTVSKICTGTIFISL